MDSKMEPLRQMHRTKTTSSDGRWDETLRELGVEMGQMTQ